MQQRADLIITPKLMIYLKLGLQKPGITLISYYNLFSSTKYYLRKANNRVMKEALSRKDFVKHFMQNRCHLRVHSFSTDTKFSEKVSGVRNASFSENFADVLHE